MYPWYGQEICHILYSGGDIYQLLLSPPDAANGFFLRNSGVLGQRQNLWVFLYLTFCTALHLRVGEPQTQALATTDHWPFQNAVCVLRLKIAKNFQLIANQKFPKTQFLNWANQRKLSRQLLQPRGVLKFSGRQNLSALQTLGVSYQRVWARVRGPHKSK
jgi:hypothetical protein